MKQGVKIYALINPLNGRMFYIGATTKELSVRLYQHINQLKSPSPYKTGSFLKRKELLAKIIKRKKLPTIELLEECDFKLANKREAFYFDKNKEILIQSRTGHFIGQFTKPK